MPGRKPYAVAVHRLNGNPSKKTLPPVGQTTEGVGSVGNAPAWFDADQRQTWRDTLAVAPIYVLTGTDRQLLVTWCVAVVDHRRAAIDIQTRGQLVPGEGKNPVVNPSVRVANHAAGIILRALAEMGFSPSSRAKLEITPGAGAANGFAEFMNDQ